MMRETMRPGSGSGSDSEAGRVNSTMLLFSLEVV